MIFNLSLLALINLALGLKQAPENLVIGIKKKVAPQDCIAAKKGDQLTMEYTGTLFSTGEQFDSSVGRAPFNFQLGVGQVIAGWDQGILGMCVGEKRKLTIPSKLGYGEQGAGGKIPGGATLVFEIELLAVNGKKMTPPKDEL